MESPQQFMKRFFMERQYLEETVKELYRPFEEKFYEINYWKFCNSKEAEQNNLESVLSIEDFGDIAKVITDGSHGCPKRIRYHLRRSEATWCISGLEWDCSFCDGTGRRYDKVCEYCHGTCWRDPLK